MRLIKPSPYGRPTALSTVTLALLLAGIAGPVQAQFKVIDADGRVTYTDRPPSPSTGAQVSPVRRDGSVGEAQPNAALPFDLREPVSRFPVTLYTAGECVPCDSARRLLRSRGVPHAEKLVDSDDAADALMRLTNGRTLPSLSVGAQVLRGYSEADWQSTLDLAGYPRESRLPRNYAQPAATPLVARPAPVAQVDPAPPPRAEPPALVEVAPVPTGPSIRF